MYKEAVDYNKLMGAMNNRAFKTKLWSVIGGIRGIKDPAELAKFVNNRVHSELSLKGAYLRPAQTIRNFVSNAIGKGRGSAAKDTATSMRDNFIHLMNRTKDDAGRLRLRSDIGDRISKVPDGRNTYRLGNTGFSAAISPGELGSPFSPMWDALYHTDTYKKTGSLYQPLQNQIISNALKETDLADDFLLKLHKAGVNPDDLDPKMIRELAAEHLKGVPVPGLGGADKRLTEAIEMMPSWSGLTTIPGHEQVGGLYGTMGFVPIKNQMGAMMYRPGGMRSKKELAQRYKDLMFGMDPRRTVADASRVGNRSAVMDLFDEVGAGIEGDLYAGKAGKALSGKEDDMMWLAGIRDRFKNDPKLRAAVKGDDLVGARDKLNRWNDMFEGLLETPVVSVPKDKVTEGSDFYGHLLDQAARMRNAIPGMSRVIPELPSTT